MTKQEFDKAYDALPDGVVRDVINSMIASGISRTGITISKKLVDKIPAGMFDYVKERYDVDVEIP